MTDFAQRSEEGGTGQGSDNPRKQRHHRGHDRRPEGIGQERSFFDALFHSVSALSLEGPAARPNDHPHDQPGGAGILGVLATDLGRFTYCPPVEGLRMFIAALLLGGIKEKDIERMVKINPARLLGL